MANPRATSNTRHRLAALRNSLADQLRSLRSSSTIYKQTKGRLGGVMDAIQIVDEELLATEQGKPSGLIRYNDAVYGWGEEPTELRPDQVAWLVQQRSGKTP